MFSPASIDERDLMTLRKHAERGSDVVPER